MAGNSTNTFKVSGGHQLAGSIVPQGAKNEALQILCATLLTDELVTVHNVPDIRDIRMLLALLKGLGVDIVKLDTHSYQFCASDIDIDFIYTDEFRKKATSIRGSVMLIGPLLTRFGKAYLPKPGGDKIGRRRLDTHLISLQKLGAKFNYDPVKYAFEIDASKLNGRFILMEEISVTGTANTIMAACMAQGTTKIFNAACEPYIQQLCFLLNRMGAKISGIQSNLLTIEGVTSLGKAEHTVLPDMIEIGSFIAAAVMTKSSLRIESAGIKHLGNILPTFRKFGITIRELGDDLFIPVHENYEIQSFIDGSVLTVYDAPWPGFTPDLLSILLVLATQARGSVLIHQKMFESRLFFVDKLIDMGAQIILCDPHRATVIGMDRKTNLRAISMTSPDIRAGVSLLIAAMSAEGTSYIHNIQQIDRGYERIDQRLNALGARIERI
jgi:UDP-N-acetylglucosamine 1-carboxyvinyltransferase